MNNINPTPFVPTPFSPDDCVPAVFPEPAGMMPVNAAMRPGDYGDMYPEIYMELYPIISSVAEKIAAGGYAPTPESISAIVDNIIKNSGLWFEDDDGEINPEALAVQSGFGRAPVQRRRRGHHNRNTLRDIVRILLLRELLDGGRRGFSY